jgi:anti-sigma regulatory factor (Ser/Thr protein kinase)
MTANGRLLDRPVTGSFTQPVPGPLRLLRAGYMDFAALESAPFWARKFTRRFLGCCHGIATDTAENAELLVSELVTNAYQATGVTSGAPYSERSAAPVIRLSLRHFPAVLLIEVIDASTAMPHMTDSGTGDESGRGLLMADALSAEWGYFPVSPDGKCVYCVLRTGETAKDSGPRRR